MNEVFVIDSTTFTAFCECKTKTGCRVIKIHDVEYANTRHIDLLSERCVISEYQSVHAHVVFTYIEGY